MRGKGEKVVRVHEAFGRWEMMLHQRQTKQPVQWPWHPKEERILERTFGVGWAGVTFWDFVGPPLRTAIHIHVCIHLIVQLCHGQCNCSIVLCVQLPVVESIFCSIVLFNCCCSTGFVQATWNPNVVDLSLQFR